MKGSRICLESAERIFYYTEGLEHGSNGLFGIQLKNRSSTFLARNFYYYKMKVNCVLYLNSNPTNIEQSLSEKSTKLAFPAVSKTLESESSLLVPSTKTFSSEQQSYEGTFSSRILSIYTIVEISTDLNHSNRVNVGHNKLVKISRFSKEIPQP